MTDPEEAALIRAWEKTVDVQQHFNDLSLRVRSFAVTVTTATLGAAMIAFRESPDAAPWIVGAGALAWLGFWMMDAFWYHQLLLGAVAQGTFIEDRLNAKQRPEFGLTKKISEKSAVVRFGREWRSATRLKVFYWGGILLFVLIGAAAGLHLADAPQTKSTMAVPTLLGEKPELLFPTRNAVLAPAQPLAFGWALVASAHRYRLEVERTDGQSLVSIALPRTIGVYVLDPTAAHLEGDLRWRALPLDEAGRVLQEVTWSPFTVSISPRPQ